MKNKKILFASIITALILLVPIRINYKDGGSIGYKSFLYEIINYASLDGKQGIEIQILGVKVYNNVKINNENAFVETPEHTIKLKDSVEIFKMNKNTWEKDSTKAVLKLKDEEGVNLFNNLLKNSVKIDGTLDMQTPRYIGEVALSENYEGSFGAKVETIIFDIDLAGGLYCKVEDKNTWYSFNQEDAANFVKYLDNIDKKL